MRAAMVFAAVASSAKAFVFDWPAELMRPQRVVMVLAACDTSQNLLELPALYSKWRALAAGPALVQL